MKKMMVFGLGVLLVAAAFGAGNWNPPSSGDKGLGTASNPWSAAHVTTVTVDVITGNATNQFGEGSTPENYPAVASAATNAVQNLGDEGGMVIGDTNNIDMVIIAETLDLPSTYADNLSIMGDLLKDGENVPNETELADILEADYNYGAVSNAAMSALPVDVWVALGDSHTEGYPAGTTSYVSFVEARLPSSVHIENQGVAGWKSYQVAAALPTDLTPFYNANSNCICTLLVGVNDFTEGETVSDTWVHYKSIIDYAINEGWEVYCITYWAWRDATAWQVAELNSLIMEYATGRYTVIDAAMRLDDTSTGLVDPKWTYKPTDDHLSNLGQETLGDAVFNQISGGARMGLPIRVITDNVVDVTGTELSLNGIDVTTRKISPYQRDFAFSWDYEESYTNVTAYLMDTNFNVESESAALYNMYWAASRFVLEDDFYRVPTNQTFAFSFNMFSKVSDFGKFIGNKTVSASGEGWGLYEALGSLYFSINHGGGRTFVVLDDEFDLNTWHHIVISFDETMTTNQICYDGNLTSMVNTSGVPVPLEDTVLGNTISDFNYRFLGAWDDFQWYRRRLSGNEAQILQSQMQRGFVD